MKIAPVADVKTHFSKYLRKCAQGPVIVTKNGHPAAVLLPVTSEEDLERLVLAYTPKFNALLDAAEGRIKKGRGVKHKDFWREIEKE